MIGFGFAIPKIAVYGQSTPSVGSGSPSNPGTLLAGV